MENKQNVWKNALNWGLIVGVVLIIYSVLMYFLDVNLEEWVKWIAFIILLAGIVYSTIQYRDNVLGGSITYTQALGFGVVISLYAAVISAVYSYLEMTIIDPDLIGKMIAIEEEKMLSQGIPDNQIEQSMEIIKMIMKPGILTLIYIPVLTFIGFVFSLITSIFLKKEGVSETFDDVE
ncbi:MAG: DUF4199 domain-containing protein [Bacteroidota bacterium]